MASSQNIIFDAYCKLTATRVELQDNWICDQSLFRLLDAHYPTFKNTFGFTQALLVWALSAYAPPLYSTAKTNMVYLSNNFGHHAPMTVIIIIRGGELHISIGNGMVNRLPSRQRLGRRGGDELRWRRVGG